MKAIHAYAAIAIILSGVNFAYSQQWQSYGGGLDAPVNSVAMYNGKIYAGGGGVFSWDGAQWVNKSNGMRALFGSSDVYALAVFNNELYAGGIFFVLTPDGNWYNNVARLAGSAWTTCGTGKGMDGSGMSEYVNYLTVFNGHLYAGGRFGTAGGDPLSPQEAAYVARFNGTQWSTVGGGMDYTVTDLVVFEGALVASGFFTNAGGATANYIAKWNGNLWSPLGSGMNGKVTALAVHNGALYAGGLFDKAGGVDAKCIAKWNGQVWAPVGNGIGGGGQVYTLASYNNELFVGGTFTTNGGNAGNYIMSWDGTRWKNASTGTDGSVITLFPDAAGLIVGGSFAKAGNISAKNIARYSFTTAVDEQQTMPVEFSLSQNYPNPFNPSTTIAFTLPSRSFVTLKVFDVMGRDVATLVSEEMQPGDHLRRWDAAGFPSGMYFYRLQAGSYSETKCLALVR